MEKVIKYLVEMSKTIDEVTLDLEQVAIRLNSVEAVFRANRDEYKVVKHE